MMLAHTLAGMYNHVRLQAWSTAIPMVIEALPDLTSWQLS